MYLAKQRVRNQRITNVKDYRSQAQVELNATDINKAVQLASTFSSRQNIIAPNLCFKTRTLLNCNSRH